MINKWKTHDIAARIVRRHGEAARAIVEAKWKQYGTAGDGDAVEQWVEIGTEVAALLDARSSVRLCPRRLELGAKRAMSWKELYSERAITIRRALEDMDDPIGRIMLGALADALDEAAAEDPGFAGQKLWRRRAS
jgi:hypothetical protein